MTRSCTASVHDCDRCHHVLNPYSLCSCRRPSLLPLLLLLLVLPLLCPRHGFCHCVCLPSIYVQLYGCCDSRIPGISVLEPLPPPTPFPMFSFPFCQNSKLSRCSSTFGVKHQFWTELKVFRDLFFRTSCMMRVWTIATILCDKVFNIVSTT